MSKSSTSEEFLSSLRELTFNSRPQINMLTMLADDYYSDAASIAYTIEDYLVRTPGDKLPVLYLIDSIVKNVRKDYVELFSRNLPMLFARVFDESSLKVRSKLYKLRTTWDEVFPKEKLAHLDTLVNNMDSGWPLVVRPSNIHVNPHFIKGGSDRCATVKGDIIREKFLKEKKELLELEKRKVELQIMQTKEVLEKEQKKLESYTTLKGENIIHNVTAEPSKLVNTERLQSSTSLKAIETENSKKLLEVSIRDPRRKSRQKEPPIDSPLSGGTDSPVTTDLESGSPYNSEDSRDRPPRKKYKPKEKKRHKDWEKESSREHKKPYKPKMSEGSHSKKRDNGHSYKPEADAILDDEYGAMDIDSPLDSGLSEDLLSAKPYPLGGPSLDKESAKTERLSESEKDGVNVSSTSSNETVPTPVVSQQSDLEKTSLPLSRTRDPRLADNSKPNPTDVPKSGPDIHSEDLPIKSSSQQVNSFSPSFVSDPDSHSVPDVETNLVETSLGEDVVTINKQTKESDTSVSTVRSEEVAITSVDDSPSLEERINVEESSYINIPSKPTSKRKFEVEEDSDKHKRRLISEPTAKEKDIVISIDLDSASSSQSPPVAPPPPSIPPLVDLVQGESTTQEDSAPELPKTKVDPLTPSSPTLVNPEELGKDTDLRLLLPRPVDRIKDEIKVENKELDPITLFGGEDVDYRQKPPQADFNMPSPPPPPVISNIHEGPTKQSWAQIKDRKSEERSPKVRMERSKRSSISHSKQSQKESSHHDSEAHCKLLIKDAEEQLRNGNISFVDYNKMLQEVVTINEERILKEAKAIYSNPPSDNLDDSRADSPVGDPHTPFDSERHEKIRDIETPREISRNPEPSRSSRIMDSQQDEGRILPRYPQNAAEPFKRDRPEKDRFLFAERRGPSDLRPPLGILDNFSVQRPPMQTCPSFAVPNMPFPMNYRPRMPQNVVPTRLPHVGVDLLLEAERERMENIHIGGHLKCVRFYGQTAVVLQAWDDPREVRFPVEPRSMFVDSMHEFVLRFGDPPTEINIDGMSSLVQLGAPTRELYVDNKFFNIQFGGRPIELLMCGRVRSICLTGPPPIVRFGPVKRTDLVAGIVSLYVNAKTQFQFFLDAKPQKFHMEDSPCVLQFADSLQTVLINGVAVPLEFGMKPHPVMFKGVTHFLRLTCLPMGIVPGQISIMNMESYTHPPVPVVPQTMMPPPPIDVRPQVFMHGMQIPPPIPPQQPVDLLPNITNPPPAAPSDKTYVLEPAAPAVAVPEQTQAVVVKTETPSFNINDLYLQLVKTGILGSIETPDVQTTPPEVEADFSKPESLKAARPSLVSKLYSGIQCSSCGIRFPPEGTKMYSRHLDWHYRQNRREKHSTKRPQCRGWYYDFANWMQYQELEDLEEDDPEHKEEGAEEETEEDIPSVAVGHRKDVECRVCGEKFEEFFDHETEEWHARNALLVEESFYHPLCYEEFKIKQETKGTDLDEPFVELDEEGPPLDDPSVEVIDLDEMEVPSPVPSPEPESLPLLGIDKVDSPEVIALDDLSDDKKEASEPELEENVKEEEPAAVESDDDILDIIPIKRKIETVELLDDDDEEEEEEKVDDEAVTESLTDDAKAEEDDFDFSKVTVKKEKDRAPPETVDSSQPSYTATIDGNIVHETAAPLMPPTRIKINIHRSAKPDGMEQEHSTDSNEATVVNQTSSPEETVEPPHSLKPKLIGIELSQQPSVEQGVELSNLCSIM